MTTTHARRPGQRPGAGENDRPARFVVHHRRRVSARALVATFTLGFFAVLFASVAIQSLRADADHSIDSLDQQIRIGAERYLELRAKLAEQEAPARVMGAARTLGMIDPGPIVPLVAPGGSNADSGAGLARSESGPDPDRGGPELARRDGEGTNGTPKA